MREENLLELKHGEPLVFGKSRDRGIRLKDCHRPEVVQLGKGVTEGDLLVHDEQGPIGYAAMLAEMQPPDWPMPVGVIRRIEAPAFDAAVRKQIDEVTADRGAGRLEDLIYSGNTWEVR